MFFLLRMAFWFSLVLLALPIGAGSGGGEVGPFAALMAAREAVGDWAGICERKPDVCATGQAAIQTIGVRAREGSRIAFEVLDERFGADQHNGEEITTGAIAPTKKDLEAPRKASR